MLVVGNGPLITRDDNRPFIENGAVAMEGNRIAALGTDEEIRKQYRDGEYIDAKGGIIMPAFINTHEHIYSAMARGLSIKGYNPKGFLDILDGQWWTIDRKLTLEQTRYSAMDTMISCIRNGVTTIFDHHASFGHIKGSLFTIAEAAKELGVRACLCYEVSDRNGMDKGKEAVMENVEFIRYALKDDTDMLLAVKYGLSQGCRTFYLYGALGGRLSHTLANLQVLYELCCQGCHGFLVGEDSIVTLIHDETACFSARCAGMLSVLAYGGAAEGVTIRGTKYEAPDVTLTPSYPIGVSNEFTAQAAEVCVRCGTLVLIWEHPDADFSEITFSGP